MTADACAIIDTGILISEAYQYVTKSLVIWRIFKMISEHFAFEASEVCSVFVAKVLGFLWFFSFENELKVLCSAGLILTTAEARNFAAF